MNNIVMTENEHHRNLKKMLFGVKKNVVQFKDIYQLLQISPIHLKRESKIELWSFDKLKANRIIVKWGAFEEEDSATSLRQRT